MTLETLTLENFLLVAAAILKMATWFWPIILLFAGFLVWEAYAERKAIGDESR